MGWLMLTDPLSLLSLLSSPDGCLLFFLFRFAPEPDSPPVPEPVPMSVLGAKTSRRDEPPEVLLFHVWLLTQSYSVGFSKSRTSVKERVFTNTQSRFASVVFDGPWYLCT